MGKRIYANRKASKGAMRARVSALSAYMLNKIFFEYDPLMGLQVFVLVLQD